MNLGEVTGLLLFAVGIYGLASRRNIVKSILSLGIVEAGVILFFLGLRFEPGLRPPIGGETAMADAVPQALTITSIVIGIAVTAVALMMFIALYHRYGTTNWDKAHKIRRKEDDK